MTPKKLPPERPVLIGYVALEEWAEDFSDWSGYITGPDNPVGANLAWQDPIQMIEMKAYDALRAERDEWKQHAAVGAALREKELARIDALRAGLKAIGDWHCICGGCKVCSSRAVLAADDKARGFG